MSFLRGAVDVPSYPDLRAQAAAARSWDRAWALIPDPVNYNDYEGTDPTALASVARARVVDERFPNDRLAIRWPKGFDPGDYRSVSHLDSLDQLIYRHGVSPATWHIEQSLPNTVVAHRTQPHGTTWRSRGLAWAGDRRRALLKAGRHEHPRWWLGMTDVRLHYPTIDLEVLTRSLRTTLAPPWTVADAINTVCLINRFVGHNRGLPIGPEASSPLGTFALQPVDRRLRGAGFWFVRFVDDIWILACSEAAATEAVDQVRDQLDSIGQQENQPKRLIVDPDDIDEAISDADIAYLVQRPGDMSDMEAIELITSSLAAQSHNKIAFGLGALRRTQSPAGIPLVIEHESLLRFEPEASGKYLRAVISKATHEQRERLVDRACTPTDDHGIGGAIRLAYALGGTALDSRSGDRLADMLASTDATHAPLRPHLAVVAARSCSRTAWPAAFDVAEDRPGLDLHRAVIATAPKPLARSDRRRIEHLANRYVESRPFAQRLENA